MYTSIGGSELFSLNVTIANFRRRQAVICVFFPDESSEAAAKQQLVHTQNLTQLY